MENLTCILGLDDDDLNGMVNKSFSYYGSGQLTGTGLSLAIGGAGLAKGLGAGVPLRKQLYEIGQKTLSAEKNAYYAGRNADPVKRGIDIVRHEGWLNAITPSFGQYWNTIGTGLTPGARNLWAAAQTAYGAASASNGTYSILSSNCP